MSWGWGWQWSGSGWGASWDEHDYDAWRQAAQGLSKGGAGGSAGTGAAEDLSKGTFKGGGKCNWAIGGKGKGKGAACAALPAPNLHPGAGSACSAAEPNVPNPWGDDESWAAMNLHHVQLCIHHQQNRCLRGDHCGYAHALRDLRKPDPKWPLAGSDFPPFPWVGVTERFAAYYAWECENGVAPKWARQLMEFVGNKPRLPDAAPLREPTGFRGPRGYWPKAEPQPVAPKKAPAPSGGAAAR